MKKLLICLSTFLVSSLSLAQTTNTENYIQARVYLEPVTTSSSTSKQVETVQYFDGLGRPKQIVNVKASPTGKDVVTHIVYDGFGRQVKDYLPVPQENTLNGAIVPNPLANATQPDVYGSEKFYAEKILENSPLDRIQQQVQVGTDWSAKPVKFDYNANVASDYVRKYKTTTTWVEGRTQTAVELPEYFLPNQLYKNTVTDEDGNKTIEFKNGRGQTLLVRKILSDTVNADTYYVYNEYNQLACVIPPLASAPTVVPATVENLYYQYRYDGRNRLVEKKLPGKGWEYMVYDKADRLIMNQDANLRPDKRWLFTKYDQFSRVIYTGITADPNGREGIQAYVDYNFTDNYEKSGSFTQNGLTVEYTGLNAFPTSMDQLLSVNYYDTYPTGTPAVPTQILGQNVLPQNAQNAAVSTKSLPTASYVKNIEDDNWTKNYTWYDNRGRAIGSHSINHLGGYTKTESELDFSGTPKQVVTRHKRLATDTERVITETFTYDHQNRLLTHTHKVDNNPAVTLSKNTYNKLSQLSNKKVGSYASVSGGDFLQSIDYQYNIRGWLTKINDPSSLGLDLFGYKIKYNHVEGSPTPYQGFPSLTVEPKFNGNIAEVDWKTATDGNSNLRRYGYVYDKLNRLSAGFYQKDTNPTLGEYFERVTYDINGNIKSLQRSGGGTGTTATSIDLLTYNYKFNNQSNILESIKDESQNNSGYPFFVTPNNISYDSNGNMKNHLDKKISSIEYNYLNLPILVNAVVIGSIFGGDAEGLRHTYKYNAGGIKYAKRVDNISPYMEEFTETGYLDGFQYQRKYSKISTSQNPYDSGSVLQFTPTSEGYFDFEKNKYIYNYTDHLGNVRLSYLNNGSSIEVLEENNYYPFGLKHEGYNPIAGNSSYQYKYQGQELQETGWYSFKWRNYMPEVGRFFNIDPLAEKYPTWSPYVFSGNRVIDARELEGLEPVEINKTTKNLVIVNQGYVGSPPPGATQSQNYAKYNKDGGIDYDGIGIINNLNSASTQVGVFASAKSDITKNDILSTIKSFRKQSPDGKLILVGHSRGADNLVEMVNEHTDIKVNLLFTLDIADEWDDDVISPNVNTAINYYNKKDGFLGSSIGGEDIEAEDPSKTKIFNFPVTAPHTEIDNKFRYNAYNSVVKELNKPMPKPSDNKARPNNENER